jgi:DNA repair protein RecO (recombination protein O)
MEWTDEGFVVGSRTFGEAKRIVTLLTAEHGLWRGMWYGRSAPLFLAMRTLVSWKGKTPDHLGTFSVQDLLPQPLSESFIFLSALSWIAYVCCHVLPERLPVKEVYPCLQVALEHGTLAGEGSCCFQSVAYFEACLLCALGYESGPLVRFLQTWQQTPVAKQQVTYQGQLFQEFWPHLKVLHQKRQEFWILNKDLN